MKQLLTFALMLCVANVQAQSLPNDKAGKEYFKRLQTERVTSSDLVEWRQIGPGMAGYCEGFWCHPTDDNVMFMSPDMYNTYGSWDGGKNWHTIKDCDGDGMDVRRLQSVTFSHQDPNFGLALAVTGHLYQSDDMGRTWQLCEEFEAMGRCSELAVDPTDDKIWYMGGGDFWNIKSNHRTKAALENRENGRFAPYIRYGEILRSTDRGRTWRIMTKGLPAKSQKTIGKKKLNIGFEVGRIIVDPTNNKNIIAATSHGVFRSTNQGQSWSASAKGLPNNMPRDLDYFYDKKSGEFILYLVEQSDYSIENGEVSCVGGVYKSTDHGASWSSITGNLAIDMSKITSYPYIKKYESSVSFWLGMNAKVFAKENKNKRPTSTIPVFNRLRVNPTNKNEIYLTGNAKHDKSFVVGDIWKSEDGGKTWFAASRATLYWKDGKDKEYWDSRNNPTGVNVKFAHLQPSFDNSEILPGNRFLEINKKGDVFACIEQQVISSTDGGKSWHQVDDDETAEGSKYWVGRGGSNMPGRKILLDTGVEGRIFLCSGEHGLWQSTPRPELKDKRDVAVMQIEGQVNKNGAHSAADVAVHPNDPNTIYMLMFRQKHRGYFRRSTDGGKTWENISRPLVSQSNESSGNLFQSSLIVDPKEPNNIYFVAMSNAVSDVSYTATADDFHDYGIYKSADGGMTWNVMNTGIAEGAAMRNVVFDPKNPAVMYAASNITRDGSVNGGLYISKDRAENWSKIKIPSVISSVNNVSIDKNGTLYISCGTDAATPEQGGVWKSADGGKSWEKIFFMPYTWQTEVSPIDTNIIAVTVPARHRGKGLTQYNPGVYLSLDGGKKWNKINHNLGQPDRVVDVKLDSKDPKKLWCALMGSGWSVGYIK